ncbi:MAG: putative bifunctional diguanylate cyclase/phosphodiesterase [Actinomycetes bacterium]
MGREARETSGATIRLLLAHVRRRGGESAVAEVLRRAATSYGAEDLEDIGFWVGYDTRIRLFEAATEVLADPDTMFKVGTEALQNGVNHALVLLLKALGSPGTCYRRLPGAVVKFSTTSTMEILDARRSSATIRYRLHDGYRHSRLDCAYARGLLSVVPQLFGLPPARIDHAECESDGYDSCLYRVSWDERSKLPWRRRRAANGAVSPELVALRGQLEALQSAASDLVEAHSLDVILQRITERAAGAVLAPSYVLAVESPRGGPALVHSVGLSDDAAAELAPALLSRAPLGAHVVAVDVESSRRWHGRLAALYAPGQPQVADERPLLQAYARHAAAALDLVIALEDSRRGESRAEALLGLAHALAGANDTRSVAEVVALALPTVVGTTRGSVLLWDAGRAELRGAASVGLTPEEHELLMSTPIPLDGTPELMAILTRHQPQVLSLARSSAVVRQLMRSLHLERLTAVPLVADGTLLGVATTAWRAGTEPESVDEVVERLGGVADQAATALAKAQLLSRIRHQSLHDALTGLPNRRLFSLRVDETLRGLGPDDGVAVLFCDLDRFKQVNDQLGHAAGDELLRQVSARLRGCVRPGDTVGRLSGDEFAVLLPGVRDVVAARDLAERAIGCFTEPFRLEGRDQLVTTSVGVAVHEGPDGRREQLLRDADSAMYVAKQHGRNQISTSSQLPDGVPPAGPSLEAELATAVQQDRLRLLYQPVVRLRGGRCEVAGAEALLRWEHPRLGLLNPAAFLPLAEETGLVVDLDLWALDAACEAVSGWDAVAGQDLHVAVNLAAATLVDPRLLGAVRTALARRRLDPSRLHVEVVESRTLVNVPEVVERLSELRQLGVRVALDDFGTGYSTLAWLQQLPVDQLKIDRTFIAALPDDERSAAVVRGVLALARAVGVQVVAEGVESVRQLEALREVGCELVQGYLLGRPSTEAPSPGLVATVS